MRLLEHNWCTFKTLKLEPTDLADAECFWEDLNISVILFGTFLHFFLLLPGDLVVKAHWCCEAPEGLVRQHHLPRPVAADAAGTPGAELCAWVRTQASAGGFHSSYSC